MSESEYRMQIIDKAGVVVERWVAGGPVESELVESICARVQDKGVGLLRTEAHVVEDVRAAFHEQLHELKSKI